MIIKKNGGAKFSANIHLDTQKQSMNRILFK